MKKYNTTTNGTINLGMENCTGYIQAVSGLCDLTEEHQSMLEAECSYWYDLKREDSSQWKLQLKRLEETRGIIFTTKLKQYFKWRKRKQYR